MSEFRGIDVSHWQGAIDWTKVKASGIQFAIIKAGGSDAGFYTDPRWEENYKGAKDNGIAVGAYYFVGPGCISSADGKADAERFLAQLNGKQFEYPVYIDVEATPASEKAGATEAAIAFCRAMEAAGYYAGIYSSTYSGFRDRLDDSKLTPFTHWVAQYASKCTYGGSYGIWQYSSSGQVNGISGRVDMDVSYQDFPSIIKAGGFRIKSITNYTSDGIISDVKEYRYGPTNQEVINQNLNLPTIAGAGSNEHIGYGEPVVDPNILTYTQIKSSSDVTSKISRMLIGKSNPSDFSGLSNFNGKSGYLCSFSPLHFRSLLQGREPVVYSVITEYHGQMGDNIAPQNTSGKTVYEYQIYDNTGSVPDGAVRSIFLSVVGPDS